eukprot:1372168-Amphidinium_carterae.2
MPIAAAQAAPEETPPPDEDSDPDGPVPEHERDQNWKVRVMLERVTCNALEIQRIEAGPEGRNHIRGLHTEFFEPTWPKGNYSLGRVEFPEFPKDSAETTGESSNNQRGEPSSGRTLADEGSKEQGADIDVVDVLEAKRDRPFVLQCGYTEKGVVVCCQCGTPDTLEKPLSGPCCFKDSSCQHRFCQEHCTTMGYDNARGCYIERCSCHDHLSRPRPQGKPLEQEADATVVEVKTRFFCCTCGAPDTVEKPLVDTCWFNDPKCEHRFCREHCRRVGFYNPGGLAIEWCYCHDSVCLPCMEDWEKAIPGSDGQCSDDDVAWDEEERIRRSMNKPRTQVTSEPPVKVPKITDTLDDS